MNIKDLMLVDFGQNKLPQFKEYFFVKKTWGAEYWITNTDKYCMKILHLLKDKHCSVHFHRVKDETFHVVEGFVRLELWHNVDLTTFKEDKPDHNMCLWPGTSIHISPRTAHRFTGLKNTTLIEVSTTHHEEDSVRLIPSSK